MSKGDTQLKIIMIQLVDKQLNAILEYNGYRGFGPYNFAYGQNASNKLIAYDEDAKAYFCDDNEFKKIKGNKHIFILEPVPLLKNRDNLNEFVK
ncbi:MAG: hypothetical protein WCK02_11460 [Bacteroidota bacterium]